jgi:oligopeptide/dipeptide ABC transporter ATP-binding protein
VDPVVDSKSSAHLLEVDDLSVSFQTSRGPARAVDGVTFTLDSQRTLGIVGESGSGKSVLARAIMGLADRNGGLTTGRVRLRGREILGLPKAQLRNIRGREISMIFQDPSTALNPLMRIGPQIAESMTRHLDVPKRQAHQMAVELLGELGIPSPRSRSRHYPHQLSGGMRQRVVIAAALACKPDLILADEPTTALDVTIQAQILDLLQTQQRERKMSMVLITHDFSVVANQADEIIVMYSGLIVERGTAEQVLDHPMMPYTTDLLAAVPSLDGPLHRRLKVIAGRPPDLSDRPAGCRFAPRCRKAQVRCHKESPPLAEEAPGFGHFYRCWYPDHPDQAKPTLQRDLVELSTIHRQAGANGG